MKEEALRLAAAVLCTLLLLFTFSAGPFAPEATVDAAFDDAHVDAPLLAVNSARGEQSGGASRATTTTTNSRHHRHASAASPTSPPFREFDCAQMQRFADNAVPLGSGANKRAAKVYLNAAYDIADEDDADATPYVLKRAILNKTSKAGHFPAAYHREKSRRNLAQEARWLRRLQSEHVVRAIGGNVQCDEAISGHIVEFLPHTLEAMALERASRTDNRNRCEWLTVFLSLAELVDALAVDAFEDPLVLCDWKEDQFAVTEDLRVRLVDVDSLQVYYSGVGYMALSKCKAQRRMMASCMGPGECFQHAYRTDGRVPEEFYCNADVGLCDGFDAASNVYGLGLVFETLFDVYNVSHAFRGGNSDTSAADADSTDAIFSSLVKVFAKMTAPHKRTRIAIAEVRSLLQTMRVAAKCRLEGTPLDKA